MKNINELYPMLNEKTEEQCEFVKDTEREIERSSLIKDDSSEIGVGCKVKDMKPHILSDLCLILNEKSIPHVKACHHDER